MRYLTPQPGKKNEYVYTRSPDGIHVFFVGTSKPTLTSRLPPPPQPLVCCNCPTSSMLEGAECGLFGVLRKGKTPLTPESVGKIDHSLARLPCSVPCLYSTMMRPVVSVIPWVRSVFVKITNHKSPLHVARFVSNSGRDRTALPSASPPSTDSAINSDVTSSDIDIPPHPLLRLAEPSTRPLDSFFFVKRRQPASYVGRGRVGTAACLPGRKKRKLRSTAGVPQKTVAGDHIK